MTVAEVEFAQPGFAEMPPGPGLAFLLDEQECDRLDDFDVVEMACAARRLASWVASLELRAIAELAARRKIQGKKLGAWDSEVGEWVTDEVAAALTLSCGTAAHLVVMAEQLAESLPLTFAALQQGRIDVAKARVIADGLRSAQPDVAADVERRVLPAAPEQTCSQLRYAVRKAIAEVDPEGCAERRRLAEEARCLELWEGDEGTADLTGRNLPGAAASAAWNRINAIAAALKADGDERTIDQLRADVFVALLRNERPGPPHESASDGPASGGPASGGPGSDGSGSDGSGSDGLAFGEPGSGQPDSGGPGPDGSGAGGRPSDDPCLDGRRLDGRPSADGPVDLGDGLSHPEHATRGGQVGPQAMAHAADDAGDTVIAPHAGQAPTTDDGSVFAFRRRGNVVHYPTIGPEASNRCDRTGGHGHIPAALFAEVGGGVEDGRAVAAAVAGAVRGELARLTDGLRREVRRRGQAALISEAVRRIKATTAELGSRWCAVTADPDGGAARHGADSYRVPVGMRRWLDARDETCRFPGCRRRAARCDADHTEPHHLGGVTCPCNLAILCRRHHQLKQRPEWQLIQVWHGVLVWIAPTGHWYVAAPEPR